MIAQVIIQLRIHVTAHPAVYIIPIHITPNDRHAVHTYNPHKDLVFISPRFRNTKSDIHIGLQRKTFRQTITCRTESSKNMRRKLPTKH